VRVNAYVESAHFSPVQIGLPINLGQPTTVRVLRAGEFRRVRRGLRL
jgi:hypothetical protein